jgi:DNA ligase (NAD+)
MVISKTKFKSKKYINTIINDPITFATNNSIQDIVKLLRYSSDKYYNSSEEVLPDEIFDTIKDILKERDPDNSFLSQIGVPINSKDKVDLPYPMASLDKIKPNDKKIDRWVKKYDGPSVISDKLDGVSAQLIKNKDGKIKLYTRGDSVQGRDISHLINKLTNKKALKNLPIGTSLRGEIIIPRKYSQQIDKLYANSRAAVSGLTGADDGDYNETVAKYAQLVIYSMIHPVDKNHIQAMKTIEKWGFKSVWYKVLKNTNNFEDVLKKVLLDRRENSEFHVDGIVIVDSSKSYIDKSVNPKHAFAFKMKFNDQVAITTVIDIDWDVTMYSYIQPTVIVKPVKIGGSIIERATGHNAKYIKDNNIGKGTKIEIVKSGDVIPYISKIIEPSKEPLMPDVKYKWNKNGVEIIVTDVKNNSDISDNIEMKKIQHFFRTLKVKYLSEGIITKMYFEGYDSIFKILSAKLSDLIKIDGIGEKMVTKIYGEIMKKIKSCELHVLMSASLKFQRGLGVKKLKLVIDTYPNIMKSKLSKKDLLDNINDIDGFSDITSKQFVNNFNDFKKFYVKLQKYIDVSHLEKDILKTQQDKSMCENMKNQKIVFTGFRDSDLEKKIVNSNGSITGSVSKNTTIVVYVESDKKSSKLIKALELYNSTGKPILIKKQDFIKKYC